MASDTLTGERINTPLRRRVWPDDYVEEPAHDGAHGVRCPKCNCPRTSVRYTRHSVGKRNLRVRECRNCGHEFPTFESAV